MEEVIEKKRCSKCNSTQIRIRVKTKDKICATCGHIENLNKGEEK
jgi:hypothetical protein